MPVNLSGDGSSSGINGLILQTLVSTSGRVTSSVNTWADTGLSVSITPTIATSKMLILVNHATGQKQNTNTGLGVRLLADATEILRLSYHVGYNNTTDRQDVGSVNGFTVHEPGSLSLITYKTQLYSYSNNGIVAVSGDTGTSSMVVMEIAA